MRILYIANYQGPDIVAQRVMRDNRALGGSRKIELISRLLQEQGHEVVILSSGIAAERSGWFFGAFQSTTTGEPNRGARVWYAAGLDVKVLNYSVATFSSIRFLRREASREAFSLLLIYNIDEVTCMLTQCYWQWIGKVPAVLEYEDSVSVTGRGTGALRRTVWRALERWLCPRLGGVISVNAALADRVKHPNTYVLPGVVDEELCEAALARRPALSGAAPWLAVYCGSLFPDKGVETICEIAAQFKGRVRFVIVGIGPLLEQLQSESQSCGGDVEVLGYLERHELNNLLVSADILLNPHKDVPGGGILPFKLVEYLVAGGVIVTTRLGNLNDEMYDYCEVTRPNRNDVAAGLERVINRRDEMIARARLGQVWARSQYSAAAVAQSLNHVLMVAVGANATKTDPNRLF